MTNQHSKTFYSISLSFHKFFILTVYFEASDACNSLEFVFGAQAIGTTIATRTFSIKVCGSVNICVITVFMIVL